MLERKPSAVAGYDGCLLRLAVDLGDRLLPAFDTASGVPLSWVHLQKVCCVATVSACQKHCVKGVRAESDCCFDHSHYS